jgi:glycosyltransferase involved in cell wall biosynthesis
VGRLRVGIDARLVRRGLGISAAIRGLVSALVDRIDFVWFGDASRAPAGVAEVVDLTGPYPLLDSPLGRRAVARHDLHCFHFAGNMGWGGPGPIPVVLTVHDLIYMETGLRARGLRQIVGHRYARANVRRAVPAASLTVTPSYATADALTRELAPDVEPIVIPWGIEQQEEVPSLKTGGGDRYVVGFASRDPRKGTRVILEAWRAMRDDDLQLWLLAGSGVPRGFQRDARRELGSKRLKLFGYQPKDTVRMILAGARALVYPSTAEGFGFPVLEGMAAGVPVVTGLSPATLEVGGSGICPIDPVDPVGSISQIVERLEGDPAFRADVIEVAHSRARLFTWDATANGYASAYERAARSEWFENAC